MGLLWLTFTLLNGLVSILSIGAFGPLAVRMLRVGEEGKTLQLGGALGILKFDFSQITPVKVAIIFFAVAAGSRGISLITDYIRTKFTTALNHRIASQALRNQMEKNFSITRNLHSSLTESQVLMEVDQYINNHLSSYMIIFSQSVLLVLTFILLCSINLPLTLMTAAYFGLILLGINKKFSEKFIKLGRNRRDLNRARFRSLREANNFCREIKLSGKAEQFTVFFQEITRKIAELDIKRFLVSQGPNVIIQLALPAGVLLMTEHLFSLLGATDKVIAVGGVFAYAGLRTMGPIQQMVRRFESIKFSAVNYETVKELLSTEGSDPIVEFPSPSFKHEIRLSNIQFNYGNRSEMHLTVKDIEIPCHKLTGISGDSGSGKSTFIDILVGLSPPLSGKIIVDGQTIPETATRCWRKHFGYVPQNPRFLDASVAENISLSLIKNQIDLERVKSVAKVSGIHDFIWDQLENRYESHLGENGQKLSNGQRQRVALARALYNQPSVLLLDEALTGIDGATADDIMTRLRKLTSTMTILLASHNPSELASCDRILHVKDGIVQELQMNHWLPQKTPLHHPPSLNSQ